MSYNNTGNRESRLPSIAQMNANTDWIRVVIGDVSSRISPTNFATFISPLISDSVLRSTVRTVAVSTGILTTDNTIFADSTAGDITLTLPVPANAFDATNSLSNTFTITQKIHGGNSVTISPNGSESIYDGTAQSSIILTSGAAVTLETDGIDWIVTSS